MVLWSLPKQEPQIAKRLAEGIPKRSDPIIRDLIEILIVSWLSMTSVSIMTPDMRVVSAPIPSPTYKEDLLEVIDVLKKFGDHMLLRIEDLNKVFIPHTKVYIPQSITIVTKRYKSKALGIDVKIGKRSAKRIMAGEPSGSELLLKGSRFTPLEFFKVRAFVERVSDGDVMVLRLLGYTPIIVNSEEIICKEKELRKWIEVDCIFQVGFKMRKWLFWHPKFTKWYIWGEAMIARAKHYFDITIYLKHSRPY